MVIWLLICSYTGAPFFASMSAQRMVRRAFISIHDLQVEDVGLELLSLRGALIHREPIYRMLYARQLLLLLSSRILLI